jgi:hypothetical protein
MPSGGSSAGGGGGGGDYMHTFIIAGILIVLAIVILVYVQSDVFGLSGESKAEAEQPPPTQPHANATHFGPEEDHDEGAPAEGFEDYAPVPAAPSHGGGNGPTTTQSSSCPPSSTALPLLQAIQQKNMGEVTGASPSDEHSAPSAAAPPAASAGAPPSGASSPCDPQQKLTPQDLLPNDTANTLWAISCPPVPCGDESTASLLQAGTHIGLNSVGNSLRNANLQLRSEPPNPQVLVSPWLNTTIGPDLQRQPLDPTC